MTTQTAVPGVEELLAGIKTPEGFTRTVEEGRWQHPNPEAVKDMPPFTVLKLESKDIWITINLYNERNYLGDGHVSFDTVMGRRSFDRYGVEDSFYIDNPRDQSNARFPFSSNARVVHGLKDKLGTVISSAVYDGWGEDRKWVDRFEILWDGEKEPEIFTKRRLSRNKIVAADVVEQTNATIQRFVEKRIPEARERLERSERVPDIGFTVTPERKSELINRLRRGERVQFYPSGFGQGYSLTSKKPRGSYVERGSKTLAEFFSMPSIWVEKFDAD